MSQVIVSTGAKRRSTTSVTKIKKKLKQRRAFNKTRVSWGLGLPQSMMVTHKYCHLYPASASAGSYGTYHFRCNGLYDPDYTSTGHQPYLFDQLSGLYDHYMVKSARIKITAANVLAQQRWAVTCFVDDDGTYSSNFQTAVERNTTGTTVLMPAGSPAKVLYQNWALAKTFNVKDGVGLSRFQGTPTTDPTEISTFCVMFSNQENSTQYLDLLVEIEYDTLWTEPADVSGS